jgi:hypothetical protein
MAKPIFVIRLNSESTPEHIEMLSSHLSSNVPDMYHDYHVIITIGSEKSHEFECYNPDSIPEDIRKRTSGLILDIIEKNIINNEY